MAFKTIEEYKEYMRKKALEYYNKKKNDPNFKKKQAERVAKWQKENPDKVRAKAKRHYQKKKEDPE